MSPLQGMEKDEIIDLAVRAETRQRRRQYRAAVLGGLIAGLIVFFMLLWVVWEINNLLDAQQLEIADNAHQAEVRAIENARILEKIENQLVPRDEFVTIERQLARQRIQLANQRVQLAIQRRQLTRQSAQLRRIEGSVAARSG